MAYLIAKDFRKVGCVALRSADTSVISKVWEEMQNAIQSIDIELVVLSRPSAYGEYAPYELIKKVDEFKSRVLAMDSAAVQRVKELRLQ